MTLIKLSLRDSMQKLVKAPGFNNGHFLAKLGRAVFLVGLP